MGDEERTGCVQPVRGMPDLQLQISVFLAGARQCGLPKTWTKRRLASTCSAHLLSSRLGTHLLIARVSFAGMTGTNLRATRGMPHRSNSSTRCSHAQLTCLRPGAPPPILPPTADGLFFAQVEWAKYDLYCVGLILVRVLFPPLWCGEHFDEFAGERDSLQMTRFPSFPGHRHHLHEGAEGTSSECDPCQTQIRTTRQNTISTTGCGG